MTNMKTKAKFILLRHSQPEAFSGPWIQPHNNPLSEHGVEQADKISNSLKEKNIDSIYSSPFTRALQTAEIIGRNLRLEVKIKENLKERAQGDLENPSLSEKQINKLWKEFEKFKTLSLEKQWISRPFPGFETDEELLKRSLICLEEISQENSGKVNLLVTHASLIKVLLIHFRVIPLEKRDDFKIKINEFFEI